MKKKILGLLILLTFLIATPVSAKEINDFHVEKNNNISLKDTINGDSAIVGNKINIKGTINGIGLVAGDTININGNLDYGFIIGNNITINNTTEKNLYIAASNITLTKNSNIKQDIFLVGDTITIKGNIKRNANIYANKVIIKEGTTINGNLRLNATNIQINKDATIKNTLKYNKNAQITIDDNAKIKNTKTYNIEKQEQTVDTNKLLSSILNMIVVFLIVAITIPKAIDKTNNMYKQTNSYFKNIGIGFLILLCMPLTGIILLASNIGIYLGLIILALYLIGIYLSLILAGYLLGNLIISKLLKLNINNYLSGIIGIITLKLLFLIPILGILLTIISLTIGLTTIWNLIEIKEKPNNKNI